MSAIKQAQAQSFYGKEPAWLRRTDSDDLFKSVRSRAYAYCSRDELIDAKCAQEQDEAVAFIVAALSVAEAQRNMDEKERLGLKEHWVASNPEVARHVVDECWSMYRTHGGQDARLLATCLGNLTDASILAPVPIP